MYRPKSLKIKNIISYEEEQYEFRNGEAVIIVGRNHDNASQKNNGSGKSAFIESLALSFSGSSIRDVRVKELVNRNAKDGETELVLYNTITKKDFKIWRKIYSGTKSAECRLWLGDEEIRLPDINTYNKFIFDEIGISKDDFFNFYLLVQANYQPFFRVGDTKKKEIINRFSGADRTDELIPLVKADVELEQPLLKELERALNTIDAKQELLQKDIADLEEKSTHLDETKKQQLVDLEEKRNKTLQEIEELKNKAEQERLDENEVSKQLSNPFRTKNIDLSKSKVEKLKFSKQTIITEIETLSQQLKNVQQDFQSEIDEIKSEEQIKINEKQELIGVIKEYEDFEMDLSKQLRGSIECPNCNHKFSLQNKEFNYEEAVQALPVVQEELAGFRNQITAIDQYINTDLNAKKNEVNSKIIAKQQEIRNTITEKNQSISEFDSKINELNLAIKTYETEAQTLSRTLKHHQDAIVEFEKMIENKQHTLLSFEDKKKEINEFSYQDEIDRKQSDIETIAVDRQQLLEQIEDQENKIKSIAEWETNFKNFKSFIANQSIKNIEDYTNLFLQQMGSDLGIKLDGFSTLSTGKLKEQISVEVLRGGFHEGSYGAFSGGERGRIDICCILAIQQLINLNCTSGGLDLLICDEILDQVDSYGLELIVQSLQNVDRTIMIVSQNEINALKEHTLLIEKRNKTSKFTTNY